MEIGCEMTVDRARMRRRAAERTVVSDMIRAKNSTQMTSTYLALTLSLSHSYAPRLSHPQLPILGLGPSDL